MLRRGQIYWADFGGAKGSEQAGMRPVLVVQNDVGNTNALTTIVALITSRVMPRRYPFQVTLPDGLLPKAGTVLCEQLRTIDRGRLHGQPLAHLDASLMAEVDAALRRSLGL